ncbi:SDR family NAD(P)-dependent oxidoreductase [soil metagenome]
MAKIAYPGSMRPNARDVVGNIDLSAKTAIVTGATSGLGIETARALAAGGCTVVLAVRDTARGEVVAVDIRAYTGNVRVSVLPLDLTDLASVRAFAPAFGADRRLDILVNNAAIMANPLTYTADGYESQFATNHLGHFLLTVSLLPNLLQQGGRVVAVSSIGHARSDIHFEDIHYRARDYDPWGAYGQSKTANSLFAVELTRRYAGQGLTANAVMPGGIMTGLQKHMSQDEIRARGWVDENGVQNPRFKTVEQGAATSVWAAVGPELDGIGGLYLEDCQAAEPWRAEAPYAGYMPHAVSPETAERLWGVSEEMVGLRPQR